MFRDVSNVVSAHARSVSFFSLRSHQFGIMLRIVGLIPEGVSLYLVLGGGFDATVYRELSPLIHRLSHPLHSCGRMLSTGQLRVILEHMVMVEEKALITTIRVSCRSRTIVQV